MCNFKTLQNKWQMQREWFEIPEAWISKQPTLLIW